MEINSARLILVLKDRAEQNGALDWRKWLWRLRLREDGAIRRAHARAWKYRRDEAVQDPAKNPGSVKAITGPDPAYPEPDPAYSVPRF